MTVQNLKPKPPTANLPLRLRIEASQPPTSVFGFTLIETLVGLSILGAFFAFILVSFINQRLEREIVVTSQNAMSALRLAQAKTLAGEDDAVWSVRLEETRYTVFRGRDFAESTSTHVSLLPDSLEIANISLAGGGSDIIFEKITGETARSGTFDIRARGSSAITSSITIAPSGKTYLTGASPAPSGTRIIDARHRAFTLGWSIKNANTLTLTFSNLPNPDTIQNIAMAQYFDAGKTVFDWTGTFSIGGQNQTLRIHTTSLTDTNTVLHVDRDCRLNTKKLRVAIDGKDIATYEADCVTVTVGPFGGTMLEP